MLKIKLSRIGKKKYPVYRLVISETARDPYGDHLEILGNYNPHTKDLVVKNDRIKYWLEKGAQMTDTVNNLLVGKKIVEGKSVAVSKLTKKTRAALAKQASEASVAKNETESVAAEEGAASTETSVGAAEPETTADKTAEDQSEATA